MTERDKEFFINAYLMITSVIQGAALGALVFAMDALQKVSASAPYDNWPYLALSFVTIAVLSYGYVDGARRLLWPVDGFDILIPFLFGLCQSVAPVSLVWGLRYYFWFYLAFAVIGFLAVANAWIKTSIFGEHIDQQRRGTRIGAIVALVAIAVICIVALTNQPVSFTWCAYCLIFIYALLFGGWCFRDWRHRTRSV